MIYARNERTGEHLLVDQLLPLEGTDWVVIKADADGWIPWNPGDPQPMNDDGMMQAKSAQGYVWSPDTADGFCWTKNSRIRYYRPILDSDPEPPEWDGEAWPPPEGARVQAKPGLEDAWYPGFVAAVGEHLGSPRVAVKTDCGRLMLYGSLSRLIRPELSAAQRKELNVFEALKALVLDSVNKGGEDFAHDEGVVAFHIMEAIRDGLVPDVRLEVAS